LGGAPGAGLAAGRIGVVSLNRVILSGTIGQYGINIEWTAAGKPQTSLTLVCEEEGKVSTTFRTFIPVLIVGTQAEALAETLEPGDVVLLAGQLAYKAGTPRDAGKLMVVCCGVERLLPAIIAGQDRADA
jgi:primosomal replication protein N